MKKQINQRVKDLFTSKLGWIIVNSSDTIVISAFLGLTVLAVYQNYFYIITSVTGIIGAIFTSVTAGIGNSIIIETKDKNFQDLNKFTFIITWISGVCVSCFLCISQPFVSIWVGKEFLLDFSVVICLCIYFFIYQINQLLCTYKDAAGLWHEDRFRELVTALTNLAMNLIMVRFIGIYGIILSTVLSMLFVGMPWLLYNLFTVLFKKTQLIPYIKKLLFYIGTVFLSTIITFYICNLFNQSDILLIIIRLVICLIVPNIIFFIIYYHTEEFKYSLQLANKMTNGKFVFLNMFKDEYNNYEKFKIE